MATDFTMKQYVDPTAIAAVAQRQAQEQAQMNQHASDQKMQMIQSLAQSVGSMVSSSIEASKNKQQQDFLANAMAAKYAPNTMQPQQGPVPSTMTPQGDVSQRSSLFPNATGQVASQDAGAPLPPVSTPDYIGQNAIKASVKQDPAMWSKLSAEMMLQTPEQQAQAAMNTQKAALELANAQKIGGPALPSTMSLLNTTYTTKGLPAPDPSLFAGATNEQVMAHIKQLGESTKTNPGDPVTLTDADRSRLKPLAMRLVAGTAKPFDLTSARGPEKEKLAMLATELDPNYDTTKVAERIKMRNDYTPSGNSGKSLTSLNTVIGHLDTLQSKIDALDNADITKYNSIANWTSKNAGRPEVSGFNAAKTLVDGELGKIVQGSGVVTNEERKQFATDLNAASSKDQAKEVISTWMDLMKSRTDAIKSNWSQGMGDAKPPVPFINDKSKKILTKHGYNPDTLEKVGSSAPGGIQVDQGALAAELKRRGL